jgi:hypothetical protein
LEAVIRAQDNFVHGYKYQPAFRAVQEFLERRDVPILELFVNVQVELSLRSEFNSSLSQKDLQFLDFSLGPV